MKIKKYVSIIVAIIMIMSMYTNSYAAGKKTSLEVIEKSSESKDLDNGVGKVSKSIVDVDSEKGEVTIELKLENYKEKQGTVVANKEQEIFLVIDDSGSMDEIITGTDKTRKETVNEAASKLVDSIFSKYSSVKMGVIKFGHYSEVISELTSDAETVKAAINKDEYVGITTNLEAGLMDAKDGFSDRDTKKIIIVLTDGVPTEHETEVDDDTLQKEGTKYADEDTYPAKMKLKELDEAGIDIISMLTEIGESERGYAEYVFGTPEAPTYGTFYYVADSDIETVVSENILESVSKIIENDAIKDVNMVDYFPSDITDNFEFSYVGDPSAGTVTPTIDENKTITWNMETLNPGETATLKYKLKLKDMNNSGLINKVIATNEKVVLKYKDTKDTEHTIVLDSSPKIELKELEDDTVATTSLSQTGETVLIVTTVSILAVAAVITWRRYKNLKIK